MSKFTNYLPDPHFHFGKTEKRISLVSLEIPRTYGTIRYYDYYTGDEIDALDSPTRWRFVLNTNHVMDSDQFSLCVKEVFDVAESDSYLVNVVVIDCIDRFIMNGFKPTSDWGELLYSGKYNVNFHSYGSDE